jgi:hypothetical protein
VLYFGLEEDDRLPSDDQLRWEPVKHVRPGDISEDAWYRILKSSPSPGHLSLSLPLSTHSVWHISNASRTPP